MPKINITTQRTNLINDLIVGLAKRGGQLTEDKERTIIEMAYQKFPQAGHEAPQNYIAKVVLTKEEIIAAAKLMGLTVTDSADVTEVKNPNCHDLTMPGDLQATSMVGDNIRTSIIRKSAGTDWHKSGDVILYRPAGKANSAEAKIDDMLKEL